MRADGLELEVLRSALISYGLARRGDRSWVEALASEAVEWAATHPPGEFNMAVAVTSRFAESLSDERHCDEGAIIRGAETFVRFLEAGDDAPLEAAGCYALASALDAIPNELCRSVMVWRLSDVSYRNISLLLGCPRATAKDIVRRSELLLAETLSALGLIE